MQLQKTLPLQLINPYQRYNDADDEAAMHKALLDLGESLITYLTGILFGEYKTFSEPDLKIETEFYRFSRQKPSFGHFLSFFRMLLSKLDVSILADKKAKSDYEAVANFVFEFNLLKEVIDSGADADFADKIFQLKKGRTAGKKGLIDLFDTIIVIRNIYAHPEDKAGPKEAKRTWPLGFDYFATLNPLMMQALLEVIQDLEILSNYKPASPKVLDDINRRASFLLETADEQQEIQLDMTLEQLNFLSSELRYLLDLNNKVYVQLYYHTIPAVNPSMAKTIIEKEKAKLIEPHLRQMIIDKLSNDGVIDEMEWLILRDTAKTGSISMDQLFSMINEACEKLSISVRAGTPDNPGEVFTTEKKNIADLTFNPWWIRYFSMVPNIDKDIIAKQKAEEKAYRNKLDVLNQAQKDFPQHAKIAAERLKQKELRKSLKELNAEWKKTQDQLKRDAKNLTAEKLILAKQKAEHAQQTYDRKVESIENKLNESTQKIEALEQTLTEKMSEISSKQSVIEQDLNLAIQYSQWGIHKNLWKELDQYVDILLSKNLNKGEEEITAQWVNTTNAWQIGTLSYTYWARIHPAKAPLENIFHIGYAIANPFKWVPKNIDPKLKKILENPISVIWTSVDDKRIEKIDTENKLILKRREYNRNLIEKYEKEFLEMEANVKVILIEHINNPGDYADLFIPVSEYVKRKDDFAVGQIYSRLWNINDFYDNGRVKRETVEQYEREMIIYLQLFANVIEQLNDYALEIGVNQDTIRQREDRFKRWQETMFGLFQGGMNEQREFKPTREQVQSWNAMASNELGMSQYLFDYILSAYRFRTRSKKEEVDN
jgi:hypothetical protein